MAKWTNDRNKDREKWRKGDKTVEGIEIQWRIFFCISFRNESPLGFDRPFPLAINYLYNYE